MRPSLIAWPAPRPATPWTSRCPSAALRVVEPPEIRDAAGAVIAIEAARGGCCGSTSSCRPAATAPRRPPGRRRTCAQDEAGERIRFAGPWSRTCSPGRPARAGWPGAAGRHLPARRCGGCAASPPAWRSKDRRRPALRITVVADTLDARKSKATPPSSAPALSWRSTCPWTPGSALLM
ncbi:MAG: hypothetical protein R3F43_09900 [bacterium]